MVDGSISDRDLDLGAEFAPGLFARGQFLGFVILWYRRRSFWSFKFLPTRVPARPRMAAGLHYPQTARFGQFSQPFADVAQTAVLPRICAFKRGQDRAGGEGLDQGGHDSEAPVAHGAEARGAAAFLPAQFQFAMRAVSVARGECPVLPVCPPAVTGATAEGGLIVAFRVMAAMRGFEFSKGHNSSVANQFFGSRT